MNGKNSPQGDACPTSERAETACSPLLGKTALVTGASRGIGASVTRQLGQLGVDVAINYRSKRPKAQAVADEVIAMGRKPLLIEADITKAEDIGLYPLHQRRPEHPGLKSETWATHSTFVRASFLIGGPLVGTQCARRIDGGRAARGDNSRQRRYRANHQNPYAIHHRIG
jgi:short chain dehydrogenase